SKIQRVAIAGIVKNTLNSKPLKRVKIILEGTEKSVTSNEEGYFMFENLASGNYILHLKRFGYQFKTCNVFVDGKPCIPQEILLMPAY
ncbi:MAG: beta-sandwich domain-containing protein, partial [Nostoc sp.]